MRYLILFYNIPLLHYVFVSLSFTLPEHHEHITISIAVTVKNNGTQYAVTTYISSAKFC